MEITFYAFIEWFNTLVKGTVHMTGAALTVFVPYIKGFVLLLAGAFLLRLLIKYLARVIQRQRYLNSSIHKIDCMSGIQFEECLKAHFEKMGYKVRLTPKSGDYGVDLVCCKGKDKFVVQAKRYQGKIGISAVQQVIGGMRYYDSEKGMVVTNSYFTKNAVELAKRSNVILWDRNTLQKKIAVSKRRKKNGGNTDYEQKDKTDSV